MTRTGGGTSSGCPRRWCLLSLVGNSPSCHLKKKKRPINIGKEDRKNPGDEPNIDIVAFVASGLGQKGKEVGWLKKQTCLIAYRGSYE